MQPRAPSSLPHRLVLRIMQLYPRAFRARYVETLTATLIEAEQGHRRNRWHEWGRVGDALLTLVRAWITEGHDHASGVGRNSRAGSVGHDARYAVRTLRRRPAFAALAILTLGVGIGASTTIFSVVNGVLLRPLPYEEPARLVMGWQTNNEWLDMPSAFMQRMATRFPLSFPVLHEWEEMATPFQAVGGFTDRRLALDFGDHVGYVWGSRITAGVFRALGVPSLLGRVLVEEDDAIGAERVAVLSHAFWQQQFGGAPDVLGQELVTTTTRFTIVGVMPPDFYFPEHSRRFWINFDDETKARPRGSQFMRTVARLSPGVTLSQAQRRMEAVTAQIAEANEGEHPYGVNVLPYGDEVVRDAKLVLLVLFAAVGLVLLIGCVNVANLFLVRATERRRELAVRSALGAWRGRLVRQLLSESILVGIVGGLAGIGIAVMTFEPVLRLLPSSLPRLDDVVLDQRVFFFATGVSIVSGILVGVFPAITASKTHIAEVLQDQARGQSGGRRRQLMQGVLVVTQVALAFVLMHSATILVTSFVRLTSVERGFDAVNVSVTSGLLLPERYDSLDQRDLFLQTVSDRLYALPGVTDVAYADNLPFSGGTSTTTVTLGAEDGLESASLQISYVSQGYFQSIGVPLVTGRAFTAGDRSGSERVAIVSEATAREFWPTSDPIGARMRRGGLEGGDDPDDWMTVVGVARDVRHSSLALEPAPKFYRPLSQRAERGVQIVVKAGVDVAGLNDLIVQTLHDLDPTIPRPTVATLEDRIASSVAVPRFRTLLVSGLAGVAALLAVIGVYGILAYTTAQRSFEFGIRVALGAKRRDVLRSVLRRGAFLAVGGLIVGGGTSLVAVRVIEEFLFETRLYDPVMLLVTVATLGAAAMVASFVPAHRATRVDPVKALRSE